MYTKGNLCQMSIDTLDPHFNQHWSNIVINSSLWKRVIAWESSCDASAYGINWGDTGQNKNGGI